MEFELNMMNGARLAFAVLALAVIAYVLVDATKPRLQVGINALLDKAQRHGVFWVKTLEGGLMQQPFHVDKAEVLARPSNRVLRSLTQQVNRMGLQPSHLEIVIDGKVMVYAIEPNSRAPRLVHNA